MKKLMSLSLLAGLLPSIALGHEGHGHTDGNTITHYFVEPQHLVFVLGLAAVVIAGTIFFRKKDKPAE
ncbi:MAG: hypothetical protein K1X61_03000 [Chitinophagales bacterium]|nr:hypothetical protein [Chitinophagales bacterium]